MNKTEYVADILGMCQALEAKPDYRQEIVKDFNGQSLKDALNDASRDRLRESRSLAKVYLTEFVKDRQRKCDDRIRQLEQTCRSLETKRDKIRFTLNRLGFDGEFRLHYNGEPVTEELFNAKLRPAYQERIELLEEARDLRRLAQRYIRKNIPCMTGDSMYDTRISQIQELLDKIS